MKSRHYACLTSTCVQKLPATHAFVVAWTLVCTSCHSSLTSNGVSCLLIVNANFCESISKSPWGRKPNKNQGPKAHQEDWIARKVQRKNTDLPQIYSKTQICSKFQIYSRIQIYCRIQFFGKMASANKDKLGPRPFWSSQHCLAHKVSNPFV